MKLKFKTLGAVAAVSLLAGGLTAIASPAAFASCDSSVMRLSKVDEAGNPVAGAMFKVSVPAADAFLIGPDQVAASTAAYNTIPTTPMDTATYSVAFTKAMTDAGLSNEVTVTSGMAPVQLVAWDIPTTTESCEAPFTVVEVKAPDGYVLDSTPHVFSQLAPDGFDAQIVNKKAPAPAPTPAPTAPAPKQVVVQSDVG